MKVKKKLDGGLKIISITFLVFFIISKNTFSSQILDYETENFIYQIIEDISNVNKISKKIKFKINNNNEINAFVDINNTIHINSGLIINCNDYVALLSVLAHEIGHIELNHISLRKKTIESSNKLNNLTLLSVIASSAITQKPELLQGSIVTSAALSNQYIIFSKEQEMEADLYALNTLKLLNTNSQSVIDLLLKIEQKLLQKGFNEESQRISTHPYFKDRIQLIKNFENNDKINFSLKYNETFNFIKAKFIGYSDNEDNLNNLDEPFKTYAESIKNARSGNLKKSLERLNTIIKNNYNNSFLLETKADILFSHGYTKEAVKFYRKNLEDYPFNYYAQIRIFENININDLSYNQINIIFEENKDILYKYYNNSNVLFKYIEIAQQLKKIEWIEFFKFILSINNMDNNDFESNMIEFQKTKDKDLLKLINIVQNIS